MKVPQHRLDAARRKLRWLRRFWEAFAAAPAGSPRTHVAEEVARAIRSEEPGARCSYSSVYRWELAYRRHGLAGLIDRTGRPGKFSRIHRGGRVIDPAELSLPALAELLADLNGMFAARLRVERDSSRMASGPRTAI